MANFGVSYATAMSNCSHGARHCWKTRSRAAHATCDEKPAIGNAKINRLPAPGALLTSIQPP
jgi:hypothetical protein